MTSVEPTIDPESILLDIVVVTYNSWPSASTELLAMINMSRTPNKVHWIFVDNSPGATDAEKISGHLTGKENLTLLTPPTNVGFAAGCNYGVSHGSAEWVGFINPDISIESSHVERILLRISQPDVADLIAIGQVTRGFHHTGIGSTPYLWFTDRPSSGKMKLIGPSGGAGVYRRRLFTDHHGFHEPLFAWGEDADLALRLTRAGATCECLELGLKHQGQHSVSSDKASRSFKARLLSRNRLWVAKRNLSPSRLIYFTIVHAFILLVLTIRNLRRGTVKASWAGYMDGLRIIVHNKRDDRNNGK